MIERSITRMRVTHSIGIASFYLVGRAMGASIRAIDVTVTFVAENFSGEKVQELLERSKQRRPVSRSN